MPTAGKESTVPLSPADRLAVASGYLRNAANASALFVLVAVLAVTWFCIVTFWPVEFWYSGDEYAYLSLAHALNLEVRLRDGLMLADSGLGNHPGVPLYWVSWICLRIVALVTGHRDAVSYALADPTAFYLATRIAAGVIALLSAFGAYLVLAPLDPWKRTVAILAYFAVDSWSLVYGLTSLGNESFALPAAVLFFWTVKAVVSSPRGAQLPWFYVGAAAAFGYLIKPPYLSILVGGMALACAMAASHDAPARSKFKLACRSVLIVLTSFVAVAACVLLIVEGRKGFAELLQTHAGFVSHTGVLGGGPAHGFSLEAIFTALHLLSTTWLPYAMAGAIVLLICATYMRWRSRTLNDREWLWSVPAVVSPSFAGLTILSHLRAYYYVPAISCFLPFILKPVMERRIFAAIVVIAVAYVGESTIRSATAMAAGQARPGPLMKADEATIEAMPLGDGEARLWTYGASGKVFVKEFVLQLAGLQGYIHDREKEPSKDISSFARVERPYRYVVFARGSYSDIATLRDKAVHDQLTQPNGMAVTIPENAIYRELLATIVVEIPQTAAVK